MWFDAFNPQVRQISGQLYVFVIQDVDYAAPWRVKGIGGGLDLHGLYIDVPCPGCGFGLDVQMIDIETQSWTRCPSCRRRIHLLEPDGSVSIGIRNSERALDQLYGAFQAYGKRR